ncbi:unnamed protein product [Cyprideis torosa]|uniref:Uncharacterized protein n=1 Tax=Cyprideis torosa TaxID=163714 RepID=A0A7R8WNH9_9CRUS|nr:unnamed protein product [Cyprideis torosa]CAG0906229.1 unnamed protein product [Cyprideis torosa]
MDKKRADLGFGSALDDLGTFTPKEKPKPKPQLTPDAQKTIAEAAGFKSRESSKMPPRKQLRRRRTGRNAQINIKTTPEAIKLFNSIADENGYIMIKIKQTSTFSTWFSGLKDARAKQKIATRIQRMKFGNPGDIKPVGEGVSEMRIPEGKGYRVYFIMRGEEIVILLCGGTKARQSRDIEDAKRLAKEL